MSCRRDATPPRLPNPSPPPPRFHGTPARSVSNPWRPPLPQAARAEAHAARADAAAARAAAAAAVDGADRERKRLEQQLAQQARSHRDLAAICPPPVAAVSRRPRLI